MKQSSVETKEVLTEPWNKENEAVRWQREGLSEGDRNYSVSHVNVDSPGWSQEGTESGVRNRRENKDQQQGAVVREL